MTPKAAQYWTLGGWFLFIVSALLFTWSSIRAGDMLAVLGSLAFLIACFLFLVPLIAQMRK